MFDLYTLVEAHLPDDKFDGEALDFIGTIVDGMIENGEHGNYAYSIMIMYPNIMLPDIYQMPPEDVLEMFAEGLVVNKILKLHAFCKGIRDGSS